MKNTDREALHAILAPVYALHGKEVRPETVRLWYGILEPYDMDQVSKAFSVLVQRSPYLPKPSEVIDFLDPATWLDPAEAYSLFPRDEHRAGLVCDETLAAWSAASELYDMGDTKGASIAFQRAYAQKRDEALAQGRRHPGWRVSEGWTEKRGTEAYESIRRLGIDKGLLEDRYAEAGKLEGGQGGGNVHPLERRLGRPDGG